METDTADNQVLFPFPFSLDNCIIGSKQVNLVKGAVDCVISATLLLYE